MMIMMQMLIKTSIAIMMMSETMIMIGVWCTVDNEQFAAMIC